MPLLTWCSLLSCATACQMTRNQPQTPNIITQPSFLGPQWVPLFEEDTAFTTDHFEQAMQNLIRQPNINSTVILRADIISETSYDYSEDAAKTGCASALSQTTPEIPVAGDDSVLLVKNHHDVQLKSVPLQPQHRPKTEMVRRIIPRNPFKDYIINQTCLVLSLKEDEHDDDYKATLIVYDPHIDTIEDCPFYLPSVQAVGILLSRGSISLHYLPFNFTDPQTIIDFKALDHGDRNIRIAYRLLQTAKKHSTGVMQGYTKRVNHDQVVSKVSFQDRYIALKKKYTKHFVDNWVESTDPRKHVFEDIAIAAFLIELWSKIYKTKDEFEFRDLGCGNGLLVNILLGEGYKGIGIDARARKSWKIYSDDVQQHLKEQVIIPSVLLRPHPAMQAIAPHLSDNGRVFHVPVNNGGEVPVVAYYSSATLLRSPNVNAAEFPKNTFIIGNHSDELTCWIPLLGHPFLVIPCCSHTLNGARVRYHSRRGPRTTPTASGSGGSSMYASLVDHVEDIAREYGWKVEREMLRIPSTRNAAIIGYERVQGHDAVKSVYDVLAMEGGAEGWVENSMSLSKRPPRKH